MNKNIMYKLKYLVFWFYVVCSTLTSNIYADYSHPYDPDNIITYSNDKGWIQTTKANIKRTQEFICDKHLCYFGEKIGALRMNPHVDIKLLPEASRPYDPNNWHFPEPTDIVRFIDKSYKHIKFERVGMAQIGDRLVYQGKLYNAV